MFDPAGNEDDGDGGRRRGGVVGTAESRALVVAARSSAATDVMGLSDDEVVGVLDDLERAQRGVGRPGPDDGPMSSTS